MTTSRQEFADGEYEAPHDGVEAQVAEIVAEVLGVDRVGRSDSFYDFGGTSLQAIRICVRIENVLGIKVQPVTLFESDVLADFVVEMGEPEAQAQGPAGG